MTAENEGEFSFADLPVIMEGISPSSLVEAMDRDRPYSGQPHTDHGTRGANLVQGLTFRDVRDCFIRACFDASGLQADEWPGSVHDLPDLDLVAVQQNMSCWIEKYMGIYPNVPRLLPSDPKEPHWCGPSLECSTWTSHEDLCPDLETRGEVL